MDQGRRATDRKAVGLLVKLKHTDVGSFAEEFATNLSPGGMFIRSRTPQPVGTPVKFEVQIAGGVRVLRGSALVRWTRDVNDPAGPPGMGLQFTEVDAATQALIDMMLLRRKPAAAAPPVAPPPAAKPDLAALEAEMRERLAAASVPVDEPLPTVAPVIAPVAPVRAVRAPVVPPVAVAARAPAPPPAGGLDLSSLFDEEVEAPAAPAAVLGSPLPDASPEDVDIPIDELIAGTPAPGVTAAGGSDEDIVPGVDFELEIPIGDEPPLAMGALEAERSTGGGLEFELDLGDGDEPPPVTASPAPLKASVPPPPPRPAGGGQDFDFDLVEDSPVSSAAPSTSGAPGGGMEFELDLSDDGGAVDLGPPPPAVAPARMAPPPPARAVPPPPPPAAFVPPPPPPAALQGGLPQVRREAPRAPEPPAQAPTVLAPVQPPVPQPPPAPTNPDGSPRLVFLSPPGPITGTGPVIGIDLGTTNSCVALLSNGRPAVLRSREGYNTIPSVISLNAQNKLLVSHRAKNQLVLRPTQTIYGAKRLVGRAYESAVVKQVRERFHYDIVPDAAGRAAVRLGDNVLSLEEVQALILRECKEMAEAHLNQKVERAVVTVPAYYSEPQREATRKAGALAGLKIERVLNEPTSAALAYGLNRELNKKVLVYDLGGGTFDATVLRIEKNVFEVLGTGGDIFLGGIDFDNLLVDFLLERFQQQEKLAFNGDGIALSRVTDAAERAKCALSERASYEVHIPMLMMDDSGKPRDLRVTMTRADMESICSPLVTRTLDVVRDVLLDANLKPSDVDDIILVGGMSRMPLVREHLKGLFGKMAMASVNADEAVALGAALYSGSVDKVSSVVLIDVLPMTIGVAMPGGGFQRVIERNSPLPAQRSFAISTSRDNEEFLELSLFQGEDTHIAANEYLGTVRMEGLPKGPKGSVRVAVTIKLDSECVLHVEAREYSTRKEVKASMATRYSSEELQKQLKVSKDTVKAAEERRGADLKDRAGRFWGFLKKVVGKA
ncbi:TIGR02266 family protein [Myxococcaceae bacterium GXIMD 01537]